MNLFEVEIKFRISNITELEQQLQRRFGGTTFSAPVVENDSFFQHPCRNFVETDECLRIRERHFEDHSCLYFLTYKGPKIDTHTKTRQEIEMPLDEPELCKAMLTSLGFCHAASVQKFRRRMKLTVNNREVDVVFDTLPDLPESSRCFVELETMASANEVEACRSLLLDLAEQLALSEPIRDSYLKLVTEVGKSR